MILFPTKFLSISSELLKLALGRFGMLPTFDTAVFEEAAEEEAIEAPEERRGRWGVDEEEGTLIVGRGGDGPEGNE